MTQAKNQNPTGTIPADAELDRPIGLLGGISLVIGGVIGMGIYALIAAVGAQAGSALWLAFAIAMTVSAIGVAPLIQIASALPRAGGGYLYTSRLLNPLIGTIASDLAILGGACSTAMVSLGLAGYIAPYLPFEMPVRALAAVLPLLFYALYLFGLRLATSLQMLLAAQLIIALLVYGIVGATKSDMSFALALPQGAGGLMMASILCYSVCMGFQVIAEMGEEMVNARRNIPLSLVIGGAIVLVIYIIVGTVFINSVDYDFEKIKAMTAPLMDTGKTFLPGFWVILLSIGALSAGLTSFNAGAIALPRELFSQARDGVMPAFLGKIDARTRSPLNAVTTFFILTVFLILLDRHIDFYGVATAVGILLMTAIIAVAAVRLPKKFPQRYANAYFKISRFWLIVFAAVSVISSLGFVFIVIMELPVVGLIYVVWILLVIAYYFLRVRWLKSSGFDWESATSRIPGYDED
jgi:APA family basic amino acid/polyamine antiporter